MLPDASRLYSFYQHADVKQVGVEVVRLDDTEMNRFERRHGKLNYKCSTETLS
jgi:hypothetical protein